MNTYKKMIKLEVIGFDEKYKMATYIMDEFKKVPRIQKYFDKYLKKQKVNVKIGVNDFIRALPYEEMNKLYSELKNNTNTKLFDTLFRLKYNDEISREEYSKKFREVDSEICFNINNNIDLFDEDTIIKFSKIKNTQSLSNCEHLIAKIKYILRKNNREYYNKNKLFIEECSFVLDNVPDVPLHDERLFNAIGQLSSLSFKGLVNRRKQYKAMGSNYTEIGALRQKLINYASENDSKVVDSLKDASALELYDYRDNRYLPSIKKKKNKK